MPRTVSQLATRDRLKQPQAFWLFTHTLYLPDMMVDIEGDYGPENDDSRQCHQVGDIPHDKLLQMLTVGDLAGVQLLKHCNETNI